MIEAAFRVGELMQCYGTAHGSDTQWSQSRPPYKGEVSDTSQKPRSLIAQRHEFQSITPRQSFGEQALLNASNADNHDEKRLR